MGWFVKPSPAMDYIQKLGSDPAAMAAFKADPDGELTRAGLTDEEKAVVRTKDRKHLVDSLLERAGGEPKSGTGG